jgi:hypothetical protein
MTYAIYAGQPPLDVGDQWNRKKEKRLKLLRPHSLGFVTGCVWVYVQVWERITVR